MVYSSTQRAGPSPPERSTRTHAHSHPISYGSATANLHFGEALDPTARVDRAVWQSRGNILLSCNSRSLEAVEYSFVSLFVLRSPSTFFSPPVALWLSKKLPVPPTTPLAEPLPPPILKELGVYHSGIDRLCAPRHLLLSSQPGYFLEICLANEITERAGPKLSTSGLYLASLHTVQFLQALQIVY